MDISFTRSFDLKVNFQCLVCDNDPNSHLLLLLTSQLASLIKSKVAIFPSCIMILSESHDVSPSHVASIRCLLDLFKNQKRSELL